MFKCIIKSVLLCALATVSHALCFNNSTGCAVAFESTPVISPVTTTANCDVSPSSLTYTYVIINDFPLPRTITYSLVLHDSLLADAVTIDDALSTCEENETLVPGQTCTIVLSFQPCTAGTINRQLVVKATDQKPLVANIKSTVFSQMAYIANDDVSDAVTICGVDETDGSLDMCQNFLDSSGVYFNSPIDIVVNNDSTVAYVANAGPQPTIPLPGEPRQQTLTTDSFIAVCDVDSNGLLQPCTKFTSSPLILQDSGLRINPANTFLYTTNSNYPPNETDQTVAVCPINPVDGSLSNCNIDYGCTTRTVPPADIGSCTPNAPGMPSDCCTFDSMTGQNGIVTLNQPNGRMAFSLDGKIVYVPNFVNDSGGNPGKYYDSNVSICEVLPDNDATNPGGFQHCQIAYGSPSFFTFLQGIDISPDGNHLYLANNFYDKQPCAASDPGCASQTNIPGGNVVICEIAPGGKALTSCQKYAGLDSSGDRTFNFDVYSTNIFTNNRLSPYGVSYAYIPNGCVDGYEYSATDGALLCQPQADSTVSVCPLMAGGLFGDCVTTTGSDLFSTADSVWIANFPYTPVK